MWIQGVSSGYRVYDKDMRFLCGYEVSRLDFKFSDVNKVSDLEI